MSLGLSSAWATNNGIGQYLMDQQAYDLPDDYYARYPASVGALSLDAVNAEGAGLIGQRPLTWVVVGDRAKIERSEEHTSELQSLMRISYAVFCLKKKRQL